MWKHTVFLPGINLGLLIILGTFNFRTDILKYVFSQFIPLFENSVFLVLQNISSAVATNKSA
jgi:hypothetical protein